MEPKSSSISPLDDLRAYRFRYNLMGTIIGAATLVLVTVPLAAPGVLAGLILARGSTPVRTLVDHDILAVTPLVDQEEVAWIVSRYDFLAVPVVDGQQYLIRVGGFGPVQAVLKFEAIADAYPQVAVVVLGERTGCRRPRSWYCLRSTTSKLSLRCQIDCLV